MNGKKLLYISGSIGLGHISKDLSIVNELRKRNPDVDVTWLAAHPASLVLKEKGETIHPYAEEFACYSAIAENAVAGNNLNLTRYVFQSSIGWIQNVMIFKRLIDEEQFDLVVGDETYEIIIGLIFRLLNIDIPFIIIYDFLGLDSMTGSPVERIGNYILNWIWSRDYRVLAAQNREALFIGEPEDIPDQEFGGMLPNKREYARANYTFIGYIVQFDPQMYADRTKIRMSLGYGDEPLIICSIGGTSVGKRLLELCNQAYPFIQQKIPMVKMVLVAGPRLSPEGIKANPGVEVRGFVPDLFKHYAASDLAISQGGFSSTSELTALRRPFIFFPIEGHSEAEFVAERLARYDAGIKMYYSQTTPQSLAEQVVYSIGKPVEYKPIRVDGARRAAQIIDRYLS